MCFGAGLLLVVPLAWTGALIGAAILLDLGMTANLTLGQRAIFVLGAECRSRVKGCICRLLCRWCRGFSVRRLGLWSRRPVFCFVDQIGAANRCAGVLSYRVAMAAHTAFVCAPAPEDVSSVTRPILPDRTTAVAAFLYRRIK